MIHKNIPTPDNFQNRGGDEKRRFSYVVKKYCNSNRSTGEIEPERRK